MAVCSLWQAALQSRDRPAHPRQAPARGRDQAERARGAKAVGARASSTGAPEQQQLLAAPEIVRCIGAVDAWWGDWRRGGRGDDTAFL